MKTTQRKEAGEKKRAIVEAEKATKLKGRGLTQTT